jgi:hypothetical protein
LKNGLEMAIKILFLTAFTIGLFGFNKRPKGYIKQSVTTTQAAQYVTLFADTAVDKAEENIRFEFTVASIDTANKTFEVNAALYNDNIEPIYFLTTTCEGEQYSLQYDTANFELTPFLLCNASFPLLVKIESKAKHNFRAHLRLISNETKIKLGFNINLVGKLFGVTNKNLANIKGGPKDSTILLWADEKTID